MATIAVFIVMVGIVVGGCIAGNALAGAPPVRVEISRGVTVTPPWEWQFGGRSPDGNSILLSQGSGSLAITVVDGSDTHAALAGVRDEWLASGSVTATDIAEVAVLRPGQTCLRFAYSGSFPEIASAVEGEVTAVGGTGLVVIFDGWAGLGEYRNVRDEIEAMIRGATIP